MARKIRDVYLFLKWLVGEINMFSTTSNHKNHFFQLNRNVVLRHVVVLLIFIFVAFIFCYQVANFANVQVGRYPSFSVTFYRAVQDMLHLPFFWMERSQINRPRDPSYTGLLAGARRFRTSFLIYCGTFWGCFVYILFPSLINNVKAV